MTHASIEKPRHEASPEDLAFARSRRKAATAGAKKHADLEAQKADEPEVHEAPEAVEEERPATSELAALKAEMNELRAMVRQQALMIGKGQTSARAQGAVADAEYAAEEAGVALAALRTTYDTQLGDWKLADGVTKEQVKAAKELCDTLRTEVDVARCLAGIIPQDHPGLRRLPPEHRVFRK